MDSSGRVFISRHVKFNEGCFPFAESAAGKVSRPSSGIFQSPCFPLHVQTSIPSTGTCPALSHTRDDEAINSASVIRSPVATNLPMTNCLPSAEFNTSASPIIEGTPPLVLPVDNIPLYDTGAQPSPHNSSSPSLENESHSSTLLGSAQNELDTAIDV
ncbi:hypothetical protein V6N13_122363 [Hibiscus sabdariffa]